MAGTLLDHESWENLLRVAPLMAGRLEETVPQKIMEELEKTSDTEVTQSGNQANTTKIPLEQKMNSMVRRKRKKRFIQGIMIDDAKPHQLATKEEVSTTTSSSVQISDIQQFAQLVELIDDDIHDRAALRYLSQYVGQPMFNLCNYDQPKPRYVHLFKSSRLVVAIGNFTLRRMQLVMTPARMLYTGRSRCEQSHLECQVAGNRVCIDSMSACDGVANCGTPDIYDEDRLMCGAYVGLRHNVCLAAITFIAVLLTFIYMVHYWLGRCVPKVSEAFFIYTEGDENILYLDTVMRSPHDIGTGVVGAKSLDAFEIDALFTVEAPKTSKFRSLLHNLLPCCFKKVDKNKSVSVDWDQLHSSPTNTMFSFPELEIRRMANMDHKDICVQTGESLEMQNMPLTIKATSKDPAERQRSVNLTSPVSSDEQKRINDELNIMKILNKRRIDSMATRTSYKLGDYEELTELSPNLEQGPEEMEIQNQFYDPRWQEQSKRYQRRSAHSKILKDDAIPKMSKLVTSKRLRFSEDVVNIPRTRGYSDDEVSISQNDDNTKPQDNVNESGPSTSKDFKRFWGGSKGRKSKKKT
ncbi:uncharacterized protein LOC106138638 [Amyelois transitella]|uniref:uncharacterized protein LOC106138638 n=1 Tax=Amyelois transitella TaxID=680683 RepID=UPI00299072DF|nr:uncharacterized protein LOC106138638 [Amyelois transitella]